MSEDGIAGYVGSRIEETAEGISAALSYASENPLKAGTLAVLSVVGGKVIANRRDLDGHQGCDLYLGSRKPSGLDGLLKDMEGKFKFRSIDEIKSWERFVAGAKSLFSRSKLLLGNGQFAFHGDLEKARKVISNLTKATGREAALLVLPDGRKIIRIGDKGNVSIGDASNVIAHSHPNGLLMLSDDMQKGKPSDISVLAKTGQYRTYLINADGNMVKWESASGQWIDDLIGTIINGIRP